MNKSISPQETYTGSIEFCKKGGKMTWFSVNKGRLDNFYKTFGFV